MHGKQKNCNSLRYQGHDVLEGYFANGRGTSKHHDKHKNPEVMKTKIYSDSTLRQYHKHWDSFCDSMKQAGYTVNGHSPRTIEEAKGYMPAYVEELKNRPGIRDGSTLSPWSIRTFFAAPAKVLGLSASDYNLPIRHREDITRSRLEVKSDAHFSATKNAELVNFACCSGLRNHKELQQIRGTDLITRNDGSYAINVACGKGGKWRESTIYGTPEQVEQVVSRMRAAGDELVWPHVSTYADVHKCRDEYSSRCYEAHARDVETLPRSEQYHCQRDLKGIVYDRAALEIASKELGHSRLDVVVSHYLGRLKK